MARGAYKVVGLIACLLYVGMVVLLFKGPTFTTSSYGEEPVSVRCGSLIAVGWPNDHSFLDSESSSSWGDHITTDNEVGTAGRLGIARDCSERRDTYLAMMLILVVPANLLTVLAILGRRDARRTHQVSPTRT
jgi:hypothetical protein